MLCYRCGRLISHIWPRPTVTPTTPYRAPIRQPNLSDLLLAFPAHPPPLVPPVSPTWSAMSFVDTTVYAAGKTPTPQLRVLFA